MAKKTGKKTGKKESKKAKSKEAKPAENKGGLKIRELKPEVSGARVKPGKRLYLTDNKDRVVPEGHKDARYLYCTENDTVPKKEFDELNKK